MTEIGFGLRSIPYSVSRAGRGFCFFAERLLDRSDYNWLTYTYGILISSYSQDGVDVSLYIKQYMFETVELFIYL